MKRILFLLLCVPLWSYAGIIITRENGNIEDVTNITIVGNKIVYTDHGSEQTIDCDAVSAILYDNGKYEEIKLNGTNNTSLNQEEYGNEQQHSSKEDSAPIQTFSSTGKSLEFNVFAYGNYIMGIYKIDHTYDGAKVEYRVLYKGQKESNWIFLGITPFAITTSSENKSEFLKGEASQFVRPGSFIIDDYKNVKKVEFRLSKEGYETVVFAPLIQPSFSGLYYYFLSLNKLKPIKVKEDETGNIQEEEDNPAINEKSKKQGKNAEKVKNEEPKRMIPQACMAEGDKAYSIALEDARERALRQGYSKDQAKAIAPEIAAKAKERAIDECYNRIVVLGEDYIEDSGSTSAYAKISQGPISLELSEKSKEIIPQACYIEGKKAYDKTIEEATAKALRQGYSKSQAAKIANDAAEEAKKNAIDDYYHRIVILGEEYHDNEPQNIDKKSKDLEKKDANKNKNSKKDVDKKSKDKKDKNKKGKGSSKKK